MKPRSCIDKTHGIPAAIGKVRGRIGHVLVLSRKNRPSSVTMFSALHAVGMPPLDIMNPAWRSNDKLFMFLDQASKFASTIVCGSCRPVHSFPVSAEC